MTGTSLNDATSSLASRWVLPHWVPIRFDLIGILNYRERKRGLLDIENAVIPEIGDFLCLASPSDSPER